MTPNKDVCLYIVGTPIGNMSDLSERAIQTLSEVDVIVAEDTRHSRKLLNHIGATVKLLSFHKDSSPQKLDELTALLQSGHSMAYISDAGTPLVADPGSLLVERAHDIGVSVVGIPGPSAVCAALSVAGFSADTFHFMGWVPRKKSHRSALWKTLNKTADTAVVFESVHRVKATLAEMANALLPKDRSVVICRELTKAFESVVRLNVGTLQQYAQPIKGEFVLVIEGTKGREDQSKDCISLREGITYDEIVNALLPVANKSDLATAMASLSPQSKRDIYRDILDRSTPLP